MDKLFIVFVVVCSVLSANANESLYDRLKNLKNSYKENVDLLKKSRQQLDQIRQVDVVSVEQRNAKRATSVPVVFQAYLSRNYPSMSPNQVIPFESVVTNVGSAYDPFFGLFKAPVSGVYEFILTSQTSPSYMVNLEIVRNKVMLCRAHAAARYSQTGVCAAMVHLSAGDDVWVRHHNGEGTYLISSHHPTFAGHLIKAD